MRHVQSKANLQNSKKKVEAVDFWRDSPPSTPQDSGKIKCDGLHTCNKADTLAGVGTDQLAFMLANNAFGAQLLSDAGRLKLLTEGNWHFESSTLKRAQITGIAARESLLKAAAAKGTAEGSAATAIKGKDFMIICSTSRRGGDPHIRVFYYHPKSNESMRNSV